jgi:N-acetylmuramoyl-L-alanine amidase
MPRFLADPCQPSRVLLACCVLLFILASGAANAVDMFEPVDKGLYAVARNGRAVFLECSPPRARAQEFLDQFLAEGAERSKYAGMGRVAIPLAELKPQMQRKVLLAVFKYDYVDERGWTHQVRFAGRGEGQETLWTLCEWLTGNGFNYKKVMKTNGITDPDLAEGQKVLFPADLLLDVMKAHTPSRLPAAPKPEPAEETQASQEAGDDGYVDPNAEGYGALLSYHEDEEGPYALYRLQPGDASLYTPVVVRFTDYRENEDILAACAIVQERSGITDVTDMETGQPVRIPLDMLAVRFLPEGAAEREEYEAILAEAQRLRAERKRVRNLEGVVVVLDPGHGGKDTGAQSQNGTYSLIEDEINYDIACRIKKILEQRTGAKVYITMRDRSQGFEPVSTRKFRHDEDEEVILTPPYRNENAKYSANLRWYLANYIYDQERRRGVNERNFVFASFHCDALFNESLRGAMIYIPGAQYRRDREQPGPAHFYLGFSEARAAQTFRSTGAERRRDEALSRGFAETLMEEFGKGRVKRHAHSAPIRNVIRRSGGRYYVPAVLRNNRIPTKVLVEVANMTNPTDCSRMADPDWRQMVAEAFVNALTVHYRS